MDNNEIIGSQNSHTVLGPTDCINKQTNKTLTVVSIQSGCSGQTDRINSRLHVHSETLRSHFKHSSKYAKGRMDRTNYSERTNKQTSQCTEGKCLPHHKQKVPLAAISVQSEYPGQAGQINSDPYVHPDPLRSRFKHSSKYAQGKINRTNYFHLNKQTNEQTSFYTKSQCPPNPNQTACSEMLGQCRTTKDKTYQWEL